MGKKSKVAAELRDAAARRGKMAAEAGASHPGAATETMVLGDVGAKKQKDDVLLAKQRLDGGGNNEQSLIDNVRDKSKAASALYSAAARRGKMAAEASAPHLDDKSLVL